MSATQDPEEGVQECTGELTDEKRTGGIAMEYGCYVLVVIVIGLAFLVTYLSATLPPQGDVKGYSAASNQSEILDQFESVVINGSNAVILGHINSPCNLERPCIEGVCISGRCRPAPNPFRPRGTNPLFGGFDFKAKDTTTETAETGSKYTAAKGFETKENRGFKDFDIKFKDPAAIVSSATD